MKLKLPIVRGLIERRILVNYRVDPDVLAQHLPRPFRPKLVNGFGIAGICLIRLAGMRPRFAPVQIGIGSEHAAHRMAVEWTDENGATKEGVYIPVRHTNSRFSAFVGGRAFPGVHRRVNFWTADSAHRVKVEAQNGDKKIIVRVGGCVVDQLPSNSVFKNVTTASDFFRCGADGWSPNRTGNGFEGLKLVTDNWAIQPLDIEHLRSNWFEDTTAFPPGTAKFDSAFLMRDIAHEWRALPPFTTKEKEAV
jgi:hypothetical protein